MTAKNDDFMSYDEARDRAKEKTMQVLEWLLHGGFSSTQTIGQLLGIHRSGVYRLLRRLSDEKLIVKDTSQLATFWRLTRQGRLFYESEKGIDTGLHEKRGVSWGIAQHDDQVQQLVIRAMAYLGNDCTGFEGSVPLALQYPSQGDRTKGKFRRPDAIIYYKESPILIEYEHTRKNPDRRKDMMSHIVDLCVEIGADCWLLCENEHMLESYRKSWLKLREKGDMREHMHLIKLEHVDRLEKMPLPELLNEPPRRYDELTLEQRLDKAEAAARSAKASIADLQRERDGLRAELEQLQQKSKDHIERLTSERDNLRRELEELKKPQKRGFFGR